MDERELSAIAARLTAGVTPASGRLASLGVVVWITGLSGAGKSTAADLLGSRFANAGLPFVRLDGDALRVLFAKPVGHDRGFRFELAMSYAWLCREIAGRGIHVICSTISLFHAVQDWNRRNIERYVEVYLKVPMVELMRRDPKGLYARASAGEVFDIVGLDLPAEEPEAPDILVMHTEATTPEESVRLILAQLRYYPDFTKLA